MIYPDRTHGVKAIDSERDMISVIAEHKWPLCMGFEFDNFLFLNDSDREDTPEYAAVIIDDVDGLMVNGHEVGRIKPLGASANEVGSFIRDLREGKRMTNVPVKLKAEPDWHHSCELCEFKEED